MQKLQSSRFIIHLRASFLKTFERKSHVFSSQTLLQNSPEIRVKTEENKAKALGLSVRFSRGGAGGYTGGVE